MKRTQIKAMVGMAAIAVGIQGAVCAKTVTITYSTWAVKTETDELVNTIFPKFEAENPGIKVKLVYAGSDYVTKMIGMMAAGKAPDVMQVEEPMMDYFDQSGQLIDLAPYIKRDKLKLKDYIDILDGRAYWETRPVGLPYHAVTSTMYYNKAMFAQAGLKEPEKTWDWLSFADMAKKMTKDANGDGSPDIYGFLMNDWECIWAPFMWANGGFLYDRQMSPTKVTVSSPQAIQALQFLQDLIHKSRTCVLGAGVPEFSGGKVAMIHEGSWCVPDLRKSIKKFDWDVQLLPRSPYTKHASARIAMGAAAVWRGSKHKNEGWKLIKFLLTSEFVQRAKAKTGLYAPLSKEQVNWTEYYPANLRPTHARTAFYESLKDAEVQTVYPTTKSGDLTFSTIYNILRNKVSAEEGLKSLQQPLEKQLATALARRRR